MKIKLDENLPEALALRLAARGHDVETVRQEGLAGLDDPPVWNAAQREARFFITQDLDFSDARRFAPGTHTGIMLVRLVSPSRSALIDRVDAAFISHDANQWTRCVVVVTEGKVRVRRPER